MPLTVLTDSDVHSLLLSLTRDEVVKLQQDLADALREYSTGNQDTSCCAEYQPVRTAITRPNGLTTLFMPASTGDSIGLKILSIPNVPLKDIPAERRETQSSSSSSHRPSSSSSLSAVDSQSSRNSTSSTHSSISLRSGSETSDRPSITSVPSNLTGAIAATPSTAPPGTLTLLDAAGKPAALLNARELTAFRTALASLIIFNRRKHIHTITVFGAGLQAYWHIRLALLLRGTEIKHVNIINRSFERATHLLREFYSANQAHWRLDVKFSAVSHDFKEYDRLLREGVRKADVIFCCTPSLEPLFAAEILTAGDGRRKGRYISAIGSVTPYMSELPAAVLLDAVRPHYHRSSFPHHRHPARGGAVVVDNLSSCLRDAGEIVQAGLNAKQLVEVGELLMLKAERLVGNREDNECKKSDKKLFEWLEKGNVIYKSVGLGLMDLMTGEDLVRLAAERGIGTTIPNF
ncbi:hypothetical protein AJ79_01368 [Helicocarpus griseus UAMH5409]|uniref:Quinate/shikimate 5-dehydrogenase/glutamyl-tRNA reductase domain-containing protein n=1 Tax=Helicocarpus griseus UAMH5409 TaxID=1447875 RepID=A0A2B7XYV5_9EURO|nr:hypothetical protein AJ79_01368 [Helicocarpus griseus UAMH5409]